MSMLNKITKASQTETFLKVLLSGEDGSGKTTSVLFGAEKPLLVIDPESKVSAYSHLVEFDKFNSQDPIEILTLSNELVQLHKQGQQLPYRSVLIDSASILYKYIVAYAVDHFRDIEGNPQKYVLEPTQFQYPQKMFYDIIQNLMDLPLHLFITSHVKDNYLRGKMFTVDPNKPLVPDVEKRLVYRVHTHIMLHRKGKNKYKAERVRNDLLDKNGDHLIPPVIDNFDNRDLIKSLHEFVNKNQGFKEPPKNPNEQNIIRDDAHASNLADDIIKMVQLLGLDNQGAADQLQQVTGKQNPYDLNSDEAQKAYEYFSNLVNNQGADGQEG